MTEIEEWQFCAFCGDDLDTGWECNGCGTDWMELAFPWWRRAGVRSLTLREWLNPNTDSHTNDPNVSNEPATRQTDTRDFKELYYELIMEVAKKWPDETRHETAKRYIVERETPDPNACASAEKGLKP